MRYDEEVVRRILAGTAGPDEIHPADFDEALARLIEKGATDTQISKLLRRGHSAVRRMRDALLAPGGGR